MANPNSFKDIQDAIRAVRRSLDMGYPSGNPESFDTFQKAREWNSAFSNNLKVGIELAKLREKAHMRQVNNYALIMILLLCGFIIGIVLKTLY